MAARRSYTVVSTECDGDISVDVIATSWLTEDEKAYFYPPSNIKKNLRCYIFEKCAGYDEKTWEKFPVRKIYQRNIKKLIEAQGIQKKYELESEQESSSNLRQRRAKYVKKPAQVPDTPSDEFADNIKNPTKRKMLPKKKGAIVKVNKKQRILNESSSDCGNSSVSDSSSEGIEDLLKSPPRRKADDDYFEDSFQSLCSFLAETAKISNSFQYICSQLTSS
ncbi:uncharacterized protein LOC135848028 [Planococcus citri]|uniref:uncharacterized protein LOC135848028 n=1 Tax=Planococcus citri TaxID=170843 RepID=UPI0031F86325